MQTNSFLLNDLDLDYVVGGLNNLVVRRNNANQVNYKNHKKEFVKESLDKNNSNQENKQRDNDSQTLKQIIDKI